MWSSNVRIPWNVTDFGSMITNGEIKINVINAHIRTVLTRSDQIENIPSYTTKSSFTVFTVIGSCQQYVLRHFIRSV